MVTATRPMIISRARLHNRDYLRSRALAENLSAAREQRDDGGTIITSRSWHTVAVHRFYST